MKMFWIFWVTCNFCYYNFRDIILLDSSSKIQNCCLLFFGYINFTNCILKSRVLRLKHKKTMSKAEFELQIKIGSWVTAEWNASIANEFSFLLFLFSNRRYKRQKSFHFRTYKVEFETFAKEFSRKREGILISLQSRFKSYSYQKKFEVVESDSLMYEWMEFSCEIIFNSKWKVKTRFFLSLQIEGFQNLSVPFSTFFFKFWNQMTKSPK